MIVKGGSRRAGNSFFAKHLLNAEDNERVEVKEMRGFTSQDVKGAFQEIDIIAGGTRVKNPFYHCSISPRESEHLTPEQWNIAVDTLEKNLGLEGHARFQIEHVKEGREHRHIIWNRLDENLKLTSDSFTYQAHDKTRRELEQLFDHEPTPDTPQPSQRKSREFADWENFRGSQTGITPHEVKEEITALFHASDSGVAFRSALEHSGYTLCRGDKRDTLCVIDSAGSSHALVRRIDGIKTAQLREFMADIDPHTLPSVKEATEFVKAQPQDESGGQGAVASGKEQAEPEQWVNPKLAVLEKFAHDHPALAPPEPSSYILPTSAQDAAAIHAASLSPMSVEEQHTAHRAWNMLEARRAEIPEPEPPQTPLDPNKELWQEWLTQERARQQDEPELER